MEIEIPNYLNMHKSRHKFTKKKKNKCDMTIKSTITKRTISSKKKGCCNNKKNPSKEKQDGRKREREY